MAGGEYIAFGRSLYRIMTPVVSGGLVQLPTSKHSSSVGLFVLIKSCLLGVADRVQEQEVFYRDRKP